MASRKRKAPRAAAAGRRSASQISDEESSLAPALFTRKQKRQRGETYATATGQGTESATADTDAGGSSSASTDGVEAGPSTGDGTGNPDNGTKRVLDTSLPPISNVREMMEDMVKRLDLTALEKSHFKLNVATVCSGTEAPIFALELIRDAFLAKGSGSVFDMQHLFSCEIEPYKQGFINRNLPPGTLIFRDVIEVAIEALTGEATTASGSKSAIPKEPLDILFAGCSCVDYSSLNTNKPSGRVPSLDRHLKQDSEKETEEGGINKGSAPVKLNEAFVNDLDAGLEELRTLQSGGESARTFFATIKLITVTRPKIVVLENVGGAPWDMYTDQIFPKTGYVAGTVSLDSKHFYLPQTRQRTYLVAIDATNIGVEAATAIVNKYKSNIEGCKRQASAPISAFLLPNDDPATVQARADMESRPLHNSDWSFSSLRHADARQNKNLRRDDNPVSMKNMRNGRVIFLVLPPHCWRGYWEGQVPRVIDLMDIIFATAHQKSIDLGYKIIMIDVSQNVDRNELYGATDLRARVESHLGIVGCITPSGMPVVTHLMRPITGAEALGLQGLPIGELVLSTETEAELRDLAGNAMTVPVVGAVTLALLDAVASETDGGPELLQRTQTVPSSRDLYLETPQDEMLEPGRANQITTCLAPLLAEVKNMVRRCYCRTRPSDILACRDCGVTACSACRGNPSHRFETKAATNLEFTPEEGKVRLSDMLPNALQLVIPPFVLNCALDSVKQPLYRSVAHKVLNEEGDHDYYFDEIKVTEVVTVCYKAANSIARLVLAPEGPCSWYIYVAPWHPQRADLLRVFDLDQPIARGQIGSGDISLPQWSVWAHGRIDLELGFTNARNNNIAPSSLSFAPEYQEVPTPSLQVWKKSVEAKVYGTYFHLPNCGTAGNRLHVNQSSAIPANSVFMMWDSGYLRDPNDDHFVWTDTTRRMEPHEYREILLHAQPTRTWEVDHDIHTPMSVFWPGYWSSPFDRVGNSGFSKSFPSQDLGQVHWGLAQTIQQASCHTDGQASVIHMPALATITAAFREFPGTAAQLLKINSCPTDDKFSIIPATRREPFLRAFAFLSNTLRRSTTPDALTLFPHLEGKWVTVCPCRDCSAAPPEITVYTKKEMKASKNNDLKLTKAIIEDPDEAALFERQYLDLPRAVAVAARFLQGSEGDVTMSMKLLFQPKTLASKCLAHLGQAHRNPARGRNAVNSDAVTSFTVELDYASTSMAGFAPFATFVQPCSEENTAGIDTTSEYELPDAAPPRMTERGHKLRLSQKEAVHWMLKRERAPLDFVKSEVEEEVVSALNLRVLGKAEWTNHFPFSSRGGVIAHEIGYGKTVVTLALIDHMRNFDKKESIDERREKVDAAWTEELSSPLEPAEEGVLPDVNHPAPSFFCHLSATLVVVPRHITSQWCNETRKFLGLASPKLIVINSTPDFYGKYTLGQLEKAEIIIVSSAVFGPAFMMRLQVVSGRGEEYPGGLSGRTLEAWYRGALKNHRILTSHYLAGRDADRFDDELMEAIHGEILPGLIKKQQADVDALVEKQVPEIDRQHYKKMGKRAGGPAGATDVGEDEDDAGQNKKQRGARKGKNAKDEVKGSWAISWLHNCSFARIVWDECSRYEDGPIGLFVANAVANSKWLISGTPKLFSLEEVCKIAAAFGIHVARPEPRMMPGLPAVTRGLKLEPMSKSEQFHVYSSVTKSAALAHHRHDRAGMFVGVHLRGNPLDPEINIEFREHILPVEMSTSDAVRYHLINQEVLDAGSDYTALPPHAREVVTLKGSDLFGMDGSAAATMLLGVLACGLGQPHALTRADDFVSRSAKLSDQMKLLWDKMLWLRRWILLLKPKQPKQSGEDPVENTLKRVETLCAHMSHALSGAGSFEEFGGAEMYQREATVVAGLQITEGQVGANARPNINSIRAQVGEHFRRDWANTYDMEKALNTWVDFFKVDSEDLDCLAEKQLLLLAKDICWLKYKVNADAAPFNGGRKDLPLLRTTIAASSQTGPRTITRTIPTGIAALAEGDMRYLSGLNEAQLREFLRVCIEARPEPPTWERAKRDFKLPDHQSKSPKTFLQECLTGHNVKFTTAHSIDNLKERLWRHEKGLGVPELYRDGRAPPDKYRDLEGATSCSGSEVAQVLATNEELKRTMVHLAKTVEDLRATRLEANFLPGYTSLAGAVDKDRAVREKTCSSCSQPLTLASESFLVVGCGHFLCSRCKSAGKFYCPVLDCQAFIHKRPVLQCSQIPPLPEGEPRAKANSVAELIKNGIPSEDFVLVFAQYRPVIEALAVAFEGAELQFLNLAATKDDAISSKLEEFKAGKAGQVLLLDMDSETSAGSNLTIANHVIFANPYVHRDQEHQARTVRQARGRCIRTPQAKEVQVYHFLARGTIEEQMLRKYSKDSPAVEAFFADFTRPWWLEE
ncbi:uncharacterized protein B0H64DRAFT_425560 [Chaetomium fimeti]|uniref:RING-type domain-containing protein n=1 Tax=Chaetomium fimeti TaxID=1854472 RepID=A0AAE0HEI1_9PEZI|nr:hypothetical protein B0H64DRAFT_425560 [Chaetomium fimeti]